MKVLVTGAGGFIGGHLVEALAERGYSVRAMMQRGESAHSLRRMTNGIQTIEGDLTDRSSLRWAVRGVQRVYNVAAKTGPWGPEAAYVAVNVRGLSDLIEEAMAAGVDRVVHTSSITVYGHDVSGTVTEDHPYRAKDDPYSRSKIAGEELVWKLVRERDAPVVVVRPGWVYGPRDMASFARILQFVQSGRGFLFGNGDNMVPLVYVKDVAEGLVRAGEADDSAIGRAYNLVDDHRVTQAEYLNTLADALHVNRLSRRVPFPALYLAGRTAELVWRVAGRRKGAPPPLTTYGVTLFGRDQRFSIERARRELGYAPAFDLQRGVEEGVQWYLRWRAGVHDDRPAVHSGG